jgi:hypothetical protein
MKLDERQQEETCSRRRLTQRRKDAISLFTCSRDKQLTMDNERAIESSSKILRVMAQMSTTTDDLRKN